MKDICLNCGTELERKGWGAACNCGAPVVVHQKKCREGGRVIGVIIDDDYCVAEILYCPDCMNKKLKEGKNAEKNM